MRLLLRCAPAASQQPQRSVALFARHGISFKKVCVRRSKRADVARARRSWMREQDTFDPARLVFIDETATSTNMVRLDTADFVNGSLSRPKQRTVERHVAVGHSVDREAGLDGGAAAGAIDLTDPSDGFDGLV